MERKVKESTDRDAGGVWHEVSARLQDTLNDATYSTWFSGASGRRLGDDTLEVTVPNEFTRSWIAGHFGSLVAAAAREVTGTPMDVRFRVEARSAPPRR